MFFSNILHGEENLVIFLRNHSTTQALIHVLHSSPINARTHTFYPYEHLRKRSIPAYVSVFDTNHPLLGVHVSASYTRFLYEDRIHVFVSDTKFSELRVCVRVQILRFSTKMMTPSATHGHVSSPTKSQVAVTDIQCRVLLCPHFGLMLFKFTSQELST
jgi:hypothetical protein